MKLGFPTLEVETALVEQVFYIMDRSAADILKKDEEEAMDELRSEAVIFLSPTRKGNPKLKD